MVRLLRIPLLLIFLLGEAGKGVRILSIQRLEENPIIRRGSQTKENGKLKCLINISIYLLVIVLNLYGDFLYQFCTATEWKITTQFAA